MSYTERDIIAMCEEAIKCPDTFYQNKFVNYKGFCKGNVKKLYTEIIADYLLKNIDKLNTIRTINRDKSYRITSHIGQKTNSNRREENLAIEMFHKKRCEFGMVLDYQIPLKNKQSDKGTGKIDLLAKKEDCIYILELKREDNTETLLRCILEVFTYFKQVNHSRLLQDYNIEPKVKILAAPLIYKEGFQYQEYNDTKKHNKVIELMERLGVSSPFTYDSSRL